MQVRDSYAGQGPLASLVAVSDLILLVLLLVGEAIRRPACAAIVNRMHQKAPGSGF